MGSMQGSAFDGSTAAGDGGANAAWTLRQPDSSWMSPR